MMWKIAASAKEIRTETTILDLSATNQKIGIYFMVESHKCTGNIHSVQLCSIVSCP